MIKDLRSVVQNLVEKENNAHLQLDKFTGSLIPVSQSSYFRHLISHPNICNGFRDFGFQDPRWLSGYVISKPPHSPSLGWHQDGWYWDHDIAYSEIPAQVFAMIYLTDTSPLNGCLKVIPRTHRQIHSLHDKLGRAHSEEVRSANNDDYTSKPEHCPADGEIDVCVKAGDVVFGDARMLHGAHSNQSDERRTVITLWYFPFWKTLPSEMQVHAQKLHLHQMAKDLQHWKDDEIESISSMLPIENASQTYRTVSRIGAEYDHNLDFMARDPGWVTGRNIRAETVY